MRLRITIFQKLLIGFLAVLFLTALLGIVALRSQYQNNTLVENLLQGSVDIKHHALEAESAFREAIMHEQHFLIHLDTASVGRFKTAINVTQQHVWAIIKADSVHLGSQSEILMKKKAAELQRMSDQYVRGFGDIVWEISLRADARMVSFAEILRTDTTIQQMYLGYNMKAERASVLAREIVRETDFSTTSAVERLAYNQKRTTFILGIISICALCTGLVLAFIISGKLSRTIIELRDAAQKVATGHRNISVQAHDNDELGDLANSFTSMVQNIDGMFKDIEEMFVELEDKSLELASANEQNQALLLNVMPPNIAERLKRGETLIADAHEHTTILFADIVGFTRLSTEYSAIQIVEILNWIFSVYDDLTAQFGLEKIKTIGDSYMAAAGVPLANPMHTEAVARMGLAILHETQLFAEQSGINLNVRVGIHTGNIVAGVIGQKKFIYDVWGDTVNTASRMESSGEAGKVHISEAVYRALQHQTEEFVFEERGEISVKGKGTMRTYFLSAKEMKDEMKENAISGILAS
ncbi:MAG: adenylate/guanylate cyclase domain-containing protein [Candidatus Kapaibacterium sp.]|nr:MAG: adenylate/guanylate cyclase domain-containing protein [Candidatus Kapabacteria bacterium]